VKAAYIFLRHLNPRLPVAASKRNGETSDDYYFVKSIWFADENVGREFSVEIDTGRLSFAEAILPADECKNLYKTDSRL